MPQASFRLLIALVVGVAALMIPFRADARVRALVVGVSRYDRADLVDMALPGAAVDAAQIAAELRRRDAAVTLLTGGAAHAAAIEAALTALASASTRGDRVVIYLAGHAVQAPARGRDEADGLDEWFLAADAGNWNAGTRSLPGAIRDKAIGEAIAAARARGADVWLIVDACSAGGLARGGGTGAVARRIDPRLLGIPGTTRGGIPDTGGLVDVTTVPGGGRLVAFQAARPGEPAWERTLADDAGTRTRRGLFTWALLRAWRSVGAGGSFADLAVATERERIGAGPPGGAALIEGDIVQPVLFAGSARDLLTVARTADRLAIDVKLGVGASARTCPGPQPAKVAPIGDAPVIVRGCRGIAVELTSVGVTQNVIAWYRDARGDMVALTGAMPRRVSPGEPMLFSFIVSNRDPATRARLPSGREQLILLNEDGTRARIVEFETGD